MEFVLAAFILGFAGSLHCLGMCGPLVIALHSGNHQQPWNTKFIYHLGRILVYASLGVVVGVVGKTFSLFGFQQILAIVAGVVMLLLILWPGMFRNAKFKTTQFSQWIKSKITPRIKAHPFLTSFLLGLVNGLLPCGLVYVALSGALITGDPIKSSLFMVVFGVATSPALLAAPSILQWAGKRLKLKSIKALQVGLVLVSVLVVLRGSGLGIPYISPKMAPDKVEVDCCHRPG
jgi:sulfite exporter TauE/SafE